jgi:hypothetical protein
LLLDFLLCGIRHLVGASRCQRQTWADANNRILVFARSVPSFVSE